MLNKLFHELLDFNPKEINRAFGVSTSEDMVLDNKGAICSTNSINPSNFHYLFLFFSFLYKFNSNSLDPRSNWIAT